MVQPHFTLGRTVADGRPARGEALLRAAPKNTIMAD